MRFPPDQFVLVASTIIVGYGNYLGGSSAGH
jgi:hypothetical protein